MAATDPPACLCVPVPDLMLADVGQVALFGAISRRRGLFSDLVAWPSVEHILQSYSAHMLTAEGEQAWAEWGGVRGPDGRPTCRPDSRLAGAAIDKGTVRTSGGL